MIKRRKRLENSNFREILSFSLLPFGLLTMGSVLGTALNIYFTDILGLTTGMVTFILLGSRIWDAINDPIMGMVVERTRTKWGKCRPYLIWMVIPLVISTAFLFYPVKFSLAGKCAYAFVAYLLFYIFYTAIDIPYQGCVPLVFPENEKRVKAVSFSNVLGSMGTILPSVLFFTFADLMSGKNKDLGRGYFVAALIFAVIGGVFIATSFFGIKEKISMPANRTKAMKCLKIAFSEKKMIFLTISAFISGGLAIYNIVLPYFSKWNCIGVLPVEKWSAQLSALLHADIKISNIGLLIPLLQIGSGVSYMISMALVPVFLKRMSKKKLWLWTSILGAIANILNYVINVYVVPYNTVSGLFVFIFIRFFATFPIGISLVLLIGMFSDLVDELEYKSGERLEGTVFSFKSLMTKISLAIFSSLSLFVLGIFKYDAARMDKITTVAGDYVNPLINSPKVDSVINGINYTSLLNSILFMMTIFSAAILILQAIPILFVKEEDKELLQKIEDFRIAKEQERQAELDKALEQVSE